MHRPTTVRRPAHRHLLPLGALAAGFGTALPVLAQTVPPAMPPAAASAAAADSDPTAASGAPADGTLPVVRVRGRNVREGKDAYQATETRIGKGRQDLRDVPQSLTVVTEKVIDDRKLDSVRDVLRNTAGISFQAAEGGEEDIKLHGISLQGTGDIFLDGMRDPAFYDRDTFGLDRIELLRGAASMLFGRGSTAGAVNQVTKQATLANQGQLDVSLSSPAGVRVVGDVNRRTGEHAAVRLVGMVTKARSNGAGTPLEKAGLAGSIRWGIDQTDEFGVTLTTLQNRNGVNYGIPFIRPTATSPVGASTLVPIDPDRSYAMGSDFNHGSASTATFSHLHRFGRDLDLTTKVRLADYTRDMRASTIRFAGAALQPGGRAAALDTLSDATVLARGTQIKKQTMQMLTAQSDLNARFAALGVKHSLQAGVDLALERKQVDAAYGAAQGGIAPAKPNTTIGTPRDGAWVDESSRSFRRGNDYVSRGIGAYVQDMVELAPSWKLIGGLRYDHLSGDYRQHAIPANASGPVTTTEYRMNVAEWSKRAALLFQPTPRLSLHLMGATSFNTSGDAYSLSAANAGIPPEQSVNIELGGQLDSADGRLTTRFGIFRNTKLHERNTDPLVNLVTLSGKRHAAGVDIDVLGRPVDGWEVFGNLTWMPVAVIDIGVPGAEGQGARPSLTPRLSGTLWSAWQVAPQWRIGGGVNGRSGQQPNRNPGFYVERFVTADLMAEWQVVPEELTLRLNVNNVTNKLAGDQLYTAFYVPVPGRVISLTGSWKF